MKSPGGTAISERLLQLQILVVCRSLGGTKQSSLGRVKQASLGRAKQSSNGVLTGESSHAMESIWQTH